MHWSTTDDQNNNEPAILQCQSVKETLVHNKYSSDANGNQTINKALVLSRKGKANMPRHIIQARKCRTQINATNTKSGQNELETKSSQKQVHWC